MKITDYDAWSEANRLAVAATTAIEHAMKRLGLKRSQLARALGVKPSRVTKVLDGETNMTLKTFASFGLACGVRWQFVGLDAETDAVAVAFPGWQSLATPSLPADFFPPVEEWHPVDAPTDPDASDSSARRESQEPEGPL